MDRAVTRRRLAAGVVLHSVVLHSAVLLGAGVIAGTPTAAAVTAIRPPDIRLIAADIVLDLVRHGQSTDDLNGILGTLPPGAPLTEMGEQQADAVAQAIAGEFPGGIAGIYASQLIRTQETAAPLAHALGLDVQVLPGLNEIGAGFLEGQPRDLITEIGYFAPMAAWVLGFQLVPELGSTVTPNGVAFDEHVTTAIDTIYNNTLTGGGPMTDVAYSSGGPIAIWALMNVENPPFLLLVQQLLATLGPPPNAGQAIIEGNPTDGWTLVSWDGTPVSQTPDLLTGLFVDYRDLVTAPQRALYDIEQAFGTGDSAAITAALQAGFQQVLTAITAFPQSVIDTIGGALGDGAGSAGQSAADSVGDVLTSLAI